MVACRSVVNRMLMRIHENANAGGGRMRMAANAWVRAIVVLVLIIQPLVASATMITLPPGSFDFVPGTVTFEVSNNDQNQPPVTITNDGPAGASQTFTFTQFNPSFGTLNSVTISFTTSFNDTLKISATNNDMETIDFFNDSTLVMKLASLAFVTDQQLTAMVNLDCSAAGDGGTCSAGPQMGSGTFTETLTTPPGTPLSPLSFFMGSGSFDLTASLSSSLMPRISPANGTDFAANSTFGGTLDSGWSGSVSVVYDFTPSSTFVPEPLTLYLLVGGLGGIALWRRRRD